MLRMTLAERRRVLLIGLGTAIVPLDTAVNIAFPAITRGFALPLPAIQWVVIAYVLTYAGLLLAIGRIGDIAGHGAVFRAGLGWSAVALAGCALAPSYPLLLAARVAQGIGAALVLACGPALLIAAYPESERPRALGLYTMMFSLGAALGPLLGGALVARWGWPSVFWFRAPLALAAFLLLPATPAARRSGGARGSFDLAGAALLALALGAALLALDRARLLPESSGTALLCAGAAALLFAAFIRRERRAAAPIIDLALFRAPGFALANLGSVLVNLASFAVLLLLPYYLARVAALPPILAGGVLAVSGIGTVAGGPLGAALIRRAGARGIAAAGALLAAAGLAAIGAGALAALPLVLALALQGLGLGLFQVAYLEFVTASFPAGARGVAGSLALLTRTLGIVTGAALLSLAYAGFEGRALAAGSGADAAFVSGLRLTFACAAVLAALAALDAVSLLRCRQKRYPTSRSKTN